MPLPRNALHLKLVSRAHVACVVAAVAVGLVALLGWQFGSDVLTGSRPWGVAMNPLSAICVILAGGSLLLRSRSDLPSGTKRLLTGTGLLVAAIGGAKGFSAAMGISFPLDGVLFASRVSGMTLGNHMAPNTALAFFFLGLGLALLDVRARNGWRPAQIFFTVPLMLGLITLAGQAFGAPSIYRVAELKPMSMNSAVALLLLSAGGLLALPDANPTRLLLSDSPGGAMFRRLLPASIVVPLTIEWVRVQGQHRNLYSHEEGSAVTSLLIVLIFIMLMTRVARILDAADAKRLAAEEALRKSAGRERRLIDANLIGVMTANLQGEITQANAEFLRIVGYEAGDLPLHTDRITPPQWRERTRVAIAQLAEHGAAHPFEKVYIRKDGTEVPVLVGASMAGPGEEIVAFALDLTAQKAAEANTARAETFLDRIIENIPNMVFVKDARDLRFVKLNRAAEELIGVPRETLLGKNDYDFFPEKEADFFVAKDRDVLASGMLLDIPEERLSTQSHGERLLHTKKVPILDDRGVPLYLLGISEDITVRREVERQIESLHRAVRGHAEQLELANKELEAFSYSVSHDLRAPLRHIGGFADLLLRTNADQLDDVARRRLTTIVESAKKMGQLIDDLLAFSRMGRAEIRRIPVDLNALVEGVVREVSGEVAGRSIRWEVSALPQVVGDPAMLRLVFVNLLSNAVKYTGTRDDPSIEVGSRPDPAKGTILYVKDNGVGFDMEYAGKLFGVFQRLHREEEFPGTGIGLANVRRIVHRHGGITWAEGAVGQGATFYFSLPALSEEKPDGSIASDLARRG